MTSGDIIDRSTHSLPASVSERQCQGSWRPLSAANDIVAKACNSHAAQKDSSKRLLRSRSTLFGGIKLEGRLKERALALLKEEYKAGSSRKTQELKKEEREGRSRDLRLDNQRLLEKFAEQQEKHKLLEKEERHRKAEAVRRRTQRRKSDLRENATNSGSAGSCGSHTETESSAAEVSNNLHTFQQERRSSAASQPTPASQEPPRNVSAEVGAVQAQAPYHTVLVRYRGMPRSQGSVPVSLSSDEFSTMTILALKARIAAATGVHSHRTCRVLNDVDGALEPLEDGAPVCHGLRHGSKLVLQPVVDTPHGTQQSAPGRGHPANDWIQQQGRIAAWRGHHCEEFPGDLSAVPSGRLIKMLRQASEDADGPLLDEDLRRKLADAAHEWEVERVLMCETPHEVLRVSEDATPTDVKHAFRRLSTLIHPDRNRSRNASQAMQTVTAAFRSMYLSSTPAENTAGSNEPHAKKKHTAKKPMRPRPVYQRSSSMNSETSRFSKKSEGVSCRYDGPQAPRWGWNS